MAKADFSTKCERRTCRVCNCSERHLPSVPWKVRRSAQFLQTSNKQYGCLLFRQSWWVWQQRLLLRALPTSNKYSWENQGFTPCGRRPTYQQQKGSRRLTERPWLSALRSSFSNLSRRQTVANARRTFACMPHHVYWCQQNSFSSYGQRRKDNIAQNCTQAENKRLIL